MKTIVTAGKGGTGKSMILAHLLKRHILEKRFGRVLVVDADPHQSLSYLLGVQPRTNLGELRHQHDLALKTGRGLEELSRRDFARQLAKEALIPLGANSDLLVMGHNDQAGCQCVVNNILGSTLDAVAEQYSLVVVDNEAGIEPIGRHTWRVDYLLLTSAPRSLELDVARQILARSGEIQREIGCACLLFNRVHERQDLNISIPAGAAVLGTLPYSLRLETEEEPDDIWLAALDQAWENLSGVFSLQGMMAGKHSWN